MKDKKERLTILDVDKPNIFDGYIPKKYTLWEEFCFEVSHICDTIRIFFRNIYYGIQNLVYYFPTIWEDRHWDYEYCIDLIEKKLIQMRNGIRKDNILAETNKVCKEIDDTLYLIQVYKNASDFYEMSQQDLLQQIKDEKDCKKKEELVQEYYVGLYQYEERQWLNLWSSIYNNMYKWWD